MASAERWSDVPVALLAYDRNGRLAAANERAVALLSAGGVLLGSAAEEAGWLVLESPDGPKPVHPVTAALRSKMPVTNVLVKIRRADGSDAWLQVDSVPAVGPDGEPSEVVVSLVDVTHLVTTSSVTSRSAGDHIVSEVVGELAEVRLQSRAILYAVTSALARMRPGTWVAALLDKNASTCQIVAADGTNPELAEYIRRRVEALDPPGHAPTTALSQHVIESGQPVLVRQARGIDLWAMHGPEVEAYVSEHPVPVNVGAVDMVTVPMRARGAVVGTLSLYERRSSNQLNEKDIEWLQAVADRTAVAIENAQLYEDAVRRLERLSSLQSISLTLSASPDLGLTLKVILDQVSAQLGVDAADVLLLDELDNMLAVAASTGFVATSVADYRLSLDEAVPGHPVSSRRITTVTPLGAFSQFRRRSLFAREGFKAYGAVPLVARGKLMGALEVFHRTPLTPDSEWSSFFEALGSVAAIAIDNAALQERARKAPPTAHAGTVAPPRNLSRLELRIIQLAVAGLSNREIASEVHLSQNTVKFHMRQIFQKTGASNRTELAHLSAKQGWG